MRLQKYLSRAGVASRREAEKLILNGRVAIDGKIVSTLGVSVDEKVAKVTFDGELVNLIEEKIVLKMYKPKAVVTTMKEQFGRKCVADFVDEEFKGIFPVGRLDYDTSGLLLLTNDGDLGAKLMHPSSNVDKTYVARIQGKISQEELDVLRSGVKLEEFITSPAKVDLIEANNAASVVEITIHEGKNRQVRRMFEEVGHKVIDLRRTRYAHLTLDGMKIGEIDKLDPEDVEKLKNACLV